EKHEAPLASARPGKNARALLRHGATSRLCDSEIESANDRPVISGPLFIIYVSRVLHGLQILMAEKSSIFLAFSVLLAQITLSVQRNWTFLPQGFGNDSQAKPR